MNRKTKLLLSTLLIAIGLFLIFKDYKNEEEPIMTYVEGKSTEFDFKMIKETVSRYKENYMISPLSIAYAVSMLKEGADGNTLKQVESVLGDYRLPKLFNVKNRISMGNLLFVNQKYKKEINTDYSKLLEKKYDSEIMFDKLEGPGNINKWIAKKTYNMIEDAIKVLDPDTVLGLVNAIAIDVKWNNEFECYNTKDENFNLDKNNKMLTPMMSDSNDVYYLESKNAKGIIKDYQTYNIKTGEREYEETEDTISLEYIAILPNGDLDEYLKTFDQKELNTLLSNKKYSNDKLDIDYYLPKYTYDFDYKDFKEALVNMGIVDAFTPNANFKKMVKENSKLNLYVNDALHKSHIEVSESGTKAAAVTAFMFKDSAIAIEEPKERIVIRFDKPFIYIIKEKNTNNIWFFGTVYKPMDSKDNPGCKTNYN